MGFINIHLGLGFVAALNLLQIVEGNSVEVMSLAMPRFVARMKSKVCAFKEPENLFIRELWGWRLASVLRNP